MKTYGAGILFRAGNKILLVKRGDTGEWAVPGGMIEPGETPQEAARREMREECRVDYTGTLRPFTLIDGYVTYLADGAPEFGVKLDEENTEWGWFAGDALPDPLHPGLVRSLAIPPLNEKQVSDLIKRGELTSPQFFVNMWLFAIRVTGTGIAFRTVDNQLTFRSPEDYLTEEFLERCAGVPLIWMHPEKNKLNSDEFADRVVGALSRGWITADNEVWAMARVYDAEAAELMSTNQLSTSPTVTYAEPQLKTVKVDGDAVLLEDEPLLLDHVAVCEAGVWDKLLDPAGVITNELVEGIKMDKEELKALIMECLASMSDKADFYVAKKDSCADDDKSPDKVAREIEEGSAFARAGDGRAVERDARARDFADQDKKDREDERRGEHRRDGKYRQSEHDRRDERRGERDKADQTEKDRRDERRGERDRADQSERDREDERRGEDRALGKYRQTEKDREDERRGEDRALGKYRQTEKDREDERRGMDRYWDEEKADQSKKDREDERRGEHRAAGEYRQTEKDRRDERRSHADESYLRREIEDIRSRLPDEISDSERAELSDAQMKADSVFQCQGKRAPMPLVGERPRAYRRRLLMQLQSSSPDYKNVDLTSISDGQMLNIAEKQIYADAQRHAADAVPAGQLREIRRADATGRVISTFQGDPETTWGPFKLGKRQITSINTQL